MADWRELYKATVLETNPTQLERLITETEDATFRRRRELAWSSGSKKERRKIAEASAALLTLKTERLGWPDTRKPNVTDCDHRTRPRLVKSAHPKVPSN
jgi:hypothetical protein